MEIETNSKRCQFDACVVNGKFSKQIREFMNERKIIMKKWKPKITFSDSCSIEEDIFENERAIGDSRHGTRKHYIYAKNNIKLSYYCSGIAPDLKIIQNFHH